MIVTVMLIWIVRVGMACWFVLVLVNVRRVRCNVVMMVMVSVIVDMGVRMFQRLMPMFVGMAFGHVKPNPDAHQSSCRQERNGDWLAQ